MEFNAQQLAAFLNGSIEGDPSVKVNTIAKIEEGKPGSLTFLANPLYTQYIYITQASIVLVNRDFVPENPISATLIRVDNAYGAFANLLELYHQATQPKPGISKLAFVHESAKVGKDVYIGEFAFVGENAVIGDRSRIYPQAYLAENSKVGTDCIIYTGVKIYRECVVGNSVTLHGGVIIGSDGFGFVPQADNNYKKVVQTGNVVIEDHVEVGSNTTIDRATLGSTIICKGVKLDNLIQIAHNVEIGENTVIAAQSGVSGSTRIGKNCMIGGQVGIIGHLTIADNVKIAAQSGVGSSITEPGQIIQGSPAFEIGKYRKAYVHFRNLTDLAGRINILEKKLKDKDQG